MPVVRRRIKIAWLLAGLVGIYAFAGLFAVPPIVRHLITKHVVETTGNTPQIGRITFNPFALRLAIHDVLVRGRDGQSLVGWKQLAVNLELRSILRRGVDFSEIFLDTPYVRVFIRRDGSLNLADLAPKQEETPSTDKSIPRIFIAHLAISGGEIDFEDHSRARPLRAFFSPLQFSLRSFATAGTAENAAEFSAQSAKGEQFSWRGRIDVSPVASAGSIAISGLQASTVEQIVAGNLPCHVPIGTIDLQANYTFRAGPVPELEIAFPIVRLRDISLSPHGVRATYITVPEITIAQTTFSLANRRLDIQRVRIVSPHANAWRDEGSLNLTRLFARPTQASTEPQQHSSEKSPWRIALNTLEVEKGAIDFTDHQVETHPRFRLSMSKIVVQGWKNTGNPKLTLLAQLGINQAGTVVISGTVAPNPLDAQLAFSLDHLDLRPFQPYVGQAVNLELSSGELDIHGDVKAVQRIDGPPEITFAGNMAIKHFRTRDTVLHQDLVTWRALQLEKIEFNQAERDLAIDTLRIDDPYARVIVSASKTLNLATLKKESTESSAQHSVQQEERVPTEPPAPLAIRLRRVVVGNGTTEFSDFSLHPNFSARIQSLNGTIVGLSSAPSARANVNLTGKVADYAPVSITGIVNPLSAKTFADLRVGFENIELTLFNPYSGKFAGYEIEKGKLTTYLHYRVQDRALEADHRIVLDQLELGEATPSDKAIDVPLGLVIAILKDRHGVIDLDVPVTGTLDDPKFRLAPLVWQALSNLLTKVATAPFAALASIFSSEEDLSYVQFAAGKSTLSRDERQKLTTLSKALADRPQLKLDIPVAALPEVDGEALAQQAMEQAISSTAQKKASPAAEKLPTVTDPEKRWNALTTLYKAQLGERVHLPTGMSAQSAEAMTYVEGALKPQYSPSQDELRALGRARAEAVQRAILMQPEVAPARIFVITGKPAVAEEDAVRLELGLK